MFGSIGRFFAKIFGRFKRPLSTEQVIRQAVERHNKAVDLAQHRRMGENTPNRHKRKRLNKLARFARRIQWGRRKTG